MYCPTHSLPSETPHCHTRRLSLLTPLLHPQSLKRATTLIQSSFSHHLQLQPCPLGLSAYIQAMVNKFRLTNSMPVATPMVTGTTLSTANSPSTPMQVMCMCGIPYAEAISSVLWPVVVSQPDAAFVVSILSQFVQNPGPAHWEALKHMIVFLGSTKDLWLTFSR